MKRTIVLLTLLTLATSAYAGTLVFNFDDARQLDGNWFIRDPRIWPAGVSLIRAPHGTSFQLP